MWDHQIDAIDDLAYYTAVRKQQYYTLHHTTTTTMPMQRNYENNDDSTLPWNHQESDFEFEELSAQPIKKEAFIQAANQK